jgi:hypothetical protein
VTAAAARPFVERRKPARGWRGWRGPEYPGDFPTLGWQVLEHMTAYLPSPRDDKEPLVLTDDQARIVLRWFELDPETGEFPNLDLILELVKGWGKGPIAGALMIEALRGPVCFDGWDADGRPVGVPRGTGDRVPPWIQIAAVSEDQTENTYGYIFAYLRANNGRAARDLRIDEGRTRLYLPDIPLARLEPVTASMGTREGQPITDAVLDETHLWDRRNGGVMLARTIRRNLAKMHGRGIETTNPPVEGGGSVSELSDPEKPAPGVMHVTRRPDEQPDPSWTDERLRASLAAVYGDAWWAPLDRFVREMRDPKNPWDEVLRFWFGIRTPGSAAAVDPRDWDLLVRPTEVPAGTLIGLGFDGSTHWDATVLRGCTRAGHTFIVGRWSRPPGASHWEVPRADVEQAVADAFARWRVGLMLADPPGWRTEIDRWAEQWGDKVVLAFDTNQATRMVGAVDRWRTAVRSAAAMVRALGTSAGPLVLPYSHDGDEFTTMQVKGTRLRRVHVAEEGDRTAYMLEKVPKIGTDSTVADILAFEAAMSMPEPEPEPEPAILLGRAR